MIKSVKGVVDINELFSNNIDTIIGAVFGSVVGAIIGGIITWISNNKKIQNSMKVEIQLRVADKICKDMTDILNLINKTYNSFNGLYVNNYHYYNNSNILKTKESRYEMIEKSRDILKESMDELETGFEEYTAYLDINEIVVKQFYNYHIDTYDKFWSFIGVMDDFRTLTLIKRYNDEPIDCIIDDQTKNKEIMKRLEAEKKRVSKSMDDLLQSLISFNNIILNEFYGKIFKSKKYSKIYEVHSGRIEAIERVYQPDKYKEIYKKNNINRKF